MPDKLRAYPDATWKEDKVKCVLIPSLAAKKRILKVFVTRNTKKNMTSKDVKRKLKIKDRFKYNITTGMKIAIPRRVFIQALAHPDVATYFVTQHIRGKGNLIYYDLRTRIKKEEWLDPDGKACTLYFRDGLFLKYEKRG